MSTREIRIAFVGGYGRSGSTLLDLLLDRVQGITAVGEIRHIFGRGLGDNELCSCGEAFRDCPFWSAVLARAFPNPTDFSRLQEAAAHVNRLRSIPALTGASPIGRRTQDDANIYTESMLRVYRAVAQITGGSVILDSSKYPVHGLAVSTIKEIDLAVVHLVRDARAVAYSWQRRRMRPEVHWEEREIRRRSLLRSAWAWNVSNYLTEGLSRCSRSYYFLRYEDFVSDPVESLGQLVKQIAGPEATVPRDVLNRRDSVPHTVAGNPIRLGSGEEVLVKADEAWRSEMPFWGKAVVTGNCFSGLHRYGYPISPWSPSTRTD